MKRSKAKGSSRILRASWAVILLAPLFLQFSCTAPQRPTLRLAGDEWFLDSLTKTGLIASFEQKTGIHVDVLHRNDRTIMSDFDRGPTDGRSPYDVVVMRHRFLGSLVQKEQILPIDVFLADPTLHDANFQPDQQLFPIWWRELSSYGGKVYGYPFTCLTTFLCYRKDLLSDPANQRTFRLHYHRELTPPTNWMEYSQLAEFFHRPKEHFYGTYIQGKQGLPLWYEWLNLVYAFGGNILDTQHGWQYGDIVVNSPQNVAATKQYLELVAFSPPDTLTYGWNEAFKALQQGHTFMGLLWNDQALDLEKPTSTVAGKIGYQLVPSNIGQPFSQLEGLTYLIPAESRHPKEAYRFLEWAISEPVQTAQTLNGSASARRSTYSDPRVQRIPYTATFLASVPIARPKPTVPESARMIDASERRLSEILRGQCSPQAGLDQLALDLKDILGNKANLRYPTQAGQ